jgi:hypothetical protein
MDDGTGYRSNKGQAQALTYRFNTQGFSYADQKVLVKALGSNFNLHANIHKSGRNFYVISIVSGSNDKFKSIVEPYIHPCFLYKLGLGFL